MHVLSITSHVCHGHVGGQAMALPLQRLGHDVSHIPTVLLSNHPAYGKTGGGPVKLVRLYDIANTLLAQGLADDCAALHCGYLGQSGAEGIVLNALERIRQHNADAIFLCDPVMGDDDRLYVEPALVQRIRDRLVPRADIITPNRFELGLLAEKPVSTLAEIEAACRQIADAGPAKIVCTSALRDGGDLLTYGFDDVGGFTVRTPYLDDAPFGTGDAFAAVLLGQLLNGHDFPQATALAAAAVHGLIRAGAATGARELDVVGGQHEVVEPSQLFSIERRSS